MKRREIWYAVVGGFVGAAMVMAVGSFAPLGAQIRSDGVFSKITCAELELVQPNGKVAVRLSQSGVYLHDSVGHVRASMTVSEDSAMLGVTNKAGNPTVIINSGEGILQQGGDSGHVFVFGEGMSERVRLSADKYGGRVRVTGTDEKSRAAIAVSERGNGVLALWDTNGYRLK